MGRLSNLREMELEQENYLAFVRRHRKYMGPPRITIQPYWFGEHYSKRTDLWGDFNIPQFSPVRLTPEEIHAMKQNTRKLPDIGLSVADRRAVAPKKFAQAFFEANQ